MPKLAASDWLDIKIAYTTTMESVRSIAAEHGISHQAIVKRAHAEGWSRDTSRLISARTKSILLGIPGPVASEVAGVATFSATEYAIESEATKRAETIRRHREEWADHRALTAAAIASLDRNAVLFSKVVAETIAIRQANERKAWDGRPAAAG